MGISNSSRRSFLSASALAMAAFNLRIASGDDIGNLKLGIASDRVIYPVPGTRLTADACRGVYRRIANRSCASVREAATLKRLGGALPHVPEFVATAFSPMLR